jgi:hypothetical protein
MQFLMKCHSRNRRIRDIGSVAWQGHGERKHSCTSTYLFNHRNHLDRGDHRMSREPQHHQSIRPCRHLERRPIRELVPIATTAPTSFNLQKLALHRGTHA